MTALSNLLQILLTVAPVQWLVCVLLAVALLQALRLISASWSALIAVIRRLAVPVWKLQFWIKCGVVGTLIFIFSAQISAWLQWAEDMANPVYLSATTAVTPTHAVALYEARIREHCDSYEAGVVIQRTAETAAKINSTPLAIYESALLECGLNPFRVRDDKVAAGWIQFTRVGCSGLGVTMPQVIAACNRRDIVFIMDLTEKYLIRKWEQAGRPDMRNTIDLYLAIFSPANIGAPPEKVIYAGFSNPAYYKNSGLDGWYKDGDRIMRGAKDGKITGWEIYLCLEKKKGLLLKQKI
jgi:hypothetical protein